MGSEKKRKKKSKDFMLTAALYFPNGDATAASAMLEANGIDNELLGLNVLEVEDSEHWEELMEKHHFEWKYI